MQLKVLVAVFSVMRQGTSASWARDAVLHLKQSLHLRHYLHVKPLLSSDNIQLRSSSLILVLVALYPRGSHDMHELSNACTRALGHQSAHVHWGISLHTRRACMPVS